tara:strand:- start:721 stop:882 length:162 start_codon:yes stop_codon:yes gene_type:complete
VVAIKKIAVKKKPNFLLVGSSNSDVFIMGYYTDLTNMDKIILFSVPMFDNKYI